jgi:hypothetical protein
MIYARKEKMRFQRFEKYYLLGVSVCIVFWIISDNSLYTNLFVQALIVIGYFPTIHNILVSRKSTESKQAWTIWLIGLALSLYPALDKHNILAIIYALRGVVMCSILLALIYKFSTKEPTRGLAEK